MKQQIRAACAAMGLVLGGAVPAAVAEVPITLNLGVSHWYFTSDHDLENNTAPMAGLEWAFNDNWAAELFYADDRTHDTGGTGVDVTTWQLDMLYYGGSYIGDSNRIRPYLAVGAGEIDYDAGSIDTVETTVNVGAGLRWMFTDRLGMRLEARVLHSLDEVQNDFLVSAGLNYYFGKVKADVVPEPMAAAPVHDFVIGLARE